MFHSEQHRRSVEVLRGYYSRLFTRRAYADIAAGGISTLFFYKNALPVIAGQSGSGSAPMALSFAACTAASLYCAYRDIQAARSHHRGDFDEAYDWRSVDRDVTNGLDKGPD